MRSTRIASALVIACMVVTACNLTAIPTPSPSPTKITSQTAPNSPPKIETRGRVELGLTGQDGRTAIATAIGSNVTIIVAFRPIQEVVEQSGAGAVTRYSADWKPHPIVGMRYCSGYGRTCDLPSEWQSFSAEQKISVPVDWIGLKKYGITAQFRDASGKVIAPATDPTEVVSNWIEITGIVDERTPVTSYLPPIQTIIAQSHSSFPVIGSVHVGSGKVKTMGARAGSQIEIPVRFEAASPAGQITEMRTSGDWIGRCLTVDEIGASAWEPYVSAKTYLYSVPINWSTFKIHVQYRDDKGNLSTVACGEIAVEGSP